MKGMATEIDERIECNHFIVSAFNVFQCFNVLMLKGTKCVQ